MTLVAGILVVSFWRGTWELLDIWFCNQTKEANIVDGTLFCLFFESEKRVHMAAYCYLAGILATFLFVCLVWLGLWRSKRRDCLEYWRIPVRFVIIYIAGFATVMVWRGIWYITDDFMFPHDPPLSYWVSAVAGFNGAFIFVCGASLLAPPAIFLYDGPAFSFRPPIAITAVATYLSITTPKEEEKKSLTPLARFFDVIFSFLILPWFVVWFWRGVWMLQDYYFWGFTDEHDLHMSLLWSSLLTIGCLYLGSDDFVIFIPLSLQKIGIIQEWVSRLVLLILAIGVVSFWRVIWYFWDEFLTFSNPTASNWVAHWIGIMGLLFMGMMSCICAPPTTLGVDAVPSYEPSRDPLFSFVPAHAKQAFVLGMFRTPRNNEDNVPEIETDFGVQGNNEGGRGLSKEGRKRDAPFTFRVC